MRFDPFRSELSFYPPLHPYLIAAARELLGGRTGVKIAQSLLGALLVFPVLAIGRRTFGPGVATAAAATAAVFPELVWQSAHFWSEPLFMAVLWAAIALLLRADARSSLVDASGAGALLALAALTRDPALYFAPVAAGWLALRRSPREPHRSPPLRALAFVAALVLVLAPWAARNHARFGTFVPVSLMGARTFWEANAGGHQDVITEYAAIEQAQGPIAAYRHALTEGFAAVRARQPWWLFEQLGRQLPAFWSAADLVVIHLERQAYGPVPALVAWMVLGLVAVPHVLVTAAFLVGVVALPLTRERALLLLLLGFYLALHVVTLGHPRLRLPVLPVVFVYAWAAWSTRPLPWKGGRRVVGLLLLIAFALCLVRDAAGILAEPAFALR